MNATLLGSDLHLREVADPDLVSPISQR